MARPPRLEISGALYHVTARGNERQAIFRDDDQNLVRKAATNDPSGEGRKTYREMHVQCDRVWAERIQLKKTELAAISRE